MLPVRPETFQSTRRLVTDRALPAPAYSQPNSTPPAPAHPYDYDLEYQRRRIERRTDLWIEQQASLPQSQFRAEKEEMIDLVLKSHQNQTPMFSPSDRSGFHRNIHNLSESHWKVQGIWNENWSRRDADTWKWKSEEDPLAGAESSSRPGNSVPRLRVTADNVDRSRPFHQFIHQMVEEFRFIEDGTTGPTNTSPTDIGSAAYEKVRNRWTKRGIWYWRWGVFPGTTWKHEIPTEELLKEDFGHHGGSHGTGQGPPQATFEPSHNTFSNRNASEQQSPASTLSSNMDGDEYGLVGGSTTGPKFQQLPTGPYHNAWSGRLGIAWKEPPLAKDSSPGNPWPALSSKIGSGASQSVPPPSTLQPRSRAGRIVRNEGGRARVPRTRPAPLGPVYPMRVPKLVGLDNAPKGLSHRRQPAPIPSLGMMQETQLRATKQHSGTTAVRNVSQS